MSDLEPLRRQFARDVGTRAVVRTAALVDAMAVVPREAFLPPGPWVVRGEGDPPGGRLTSDADARHVYQDASVAIDSSRQLFNGGPSAVVPAIDALCLEAGSRVLHVGCGLGYYTALMARIVGESGCVDAVEVDETLAARAHRNLETYGQVTVRHGDGATVAGGLFDAILVQAGVTHPLDAWLDALVPGGRLVLPITASMPALGPLGKGLMLALTHQDDGTFDARVLGFVMIYTAEGVRDESLNGIIGAALMKGPLAAPARLRRDPHDQEPACWLHMPAACLGSAV